MKTYSTQAEYDAARNERMANSLAHRRVMTLTLTDDEIDALHVAGYELIEKNTREMRELAK